MIDRTRIGALPATAGLVLGMVCGMVFAGQAARAQYANLLSDPGSYGFPGPANQASNSAEVGYGSNAMSSASIRMDSGLLGNTGARGFLQLGAGSSGDLRTLDGAKARVTGQGVSAGLEKTFGDGMTLSVQGGWERDRFSVNHPACCSTLLP